MKFNLKTLPKTLILKKHILRALVATKYFTFLFLITGCSSENNTFNFEENFCSIADAISQKYEFKRDSITNKVLLSTEFRFLEPQGNFYAVTPVELYTICDSTFMFRDADEYKELYGRYHFTFRTKKNKLVVYLNYTCIHKYPEVYCSSYEMIFLLKKTTTWKVEKFDYLPIWDFDELLEYD